MCAYSRVAPWWRRERSGDGLGLASSGAVSTVCAVCVNSSEFFRAGRSAQRPSRKINRATCATPENLRPGAEPQSGRGDARRMQRRRRGRSRRPGPFPRTSPPNLVTRPCGLDPHVARVRSVSELNMLQLAANCQRSRVGGHLQRSAQRKRLAFWSPISHCISHLGAPRILEPHVCAATQLAPISLVATQLAPISP
jgi:hypothetical protein